jgi:signal transduction histidine kinase
MANPCKILIVDDDPNIQKLLSVALSPLGCETTEALDAFEAQERLEASRFDIAVVDFMLPGPDGIDILRYIREKGLDTAVIMITAYASVETAVEALRLGAYDYITKPFQIDAIRSTIERALEKRHLETRLEALSEIGHAITSTLDLHETLTLIASHTVQLLNVEASSLLLCDEGRGDLWFAAGSGGSTESMIGKRLEMGQGIAGWVAQHGEQALVPDVSQDSRWFSGFDEESSFISHSVLCVPLQSKGRIIGALEAINKRGEPFNEEDVRLLSALAAPAATAIENAQLFDQVRISREQLQALSRRLVEVQEAERAHVARELHDETGQALSAMLLNLGLLEQEAGQPEAVTRRVLELEVLADEMLENLHRLAMNLRPATLDHLGLVAALEQYIKTFERQHSITAQIETTGLGNERLPPEIETTFYRIVQESLTNVARHARASHVDVLVERHGDRVRVIVEDDGVGFDPEATIQSSRMGLIGVRERAEMLGGILEIESTPGTGTTVFVEVPCGRSIING